MAGVKRNEGRNGEIWKAYVSGRTQEWIADQYGLTQQTVSEIIANVRASIKPDDRQDQVQRSFDLLNQMRATALEIAEMAAAPIAVGKDGNILYDPVLRGPDGERLVVRDYSGKLRAMETAQKMDESIRKLIGADAAQRTQTEATVRYEIVGIDVDDLK